MRKTMMKKLIMMAALVLAALILAPAGTILAYNPLKDGGDPEIDKKNPDTGYRVVIYDGAELLSDSEIKKLATEMMGITEFGNVAFVSTDDNNYGDIMKYSRAVYEDMFGSDSGTMIIIDMDEREISIYSDGAVRRVITDSYGYDITDNIYRYASKKDYYGCASEGFSEIYRVLNGEKVARPMKYACSALIALMLAFLINYVRISSASKIQKTSDKEMLKGASKSLKYSNPEVRKTGETRTYSPVSSGSSSGGGGSHRSGGGGSHHSSGGGGHHRF